ncbi:hypothetical protein PAT3040_04900 [Paenibacillus agaridevorans]|uniref:Uncharacterized protein n=2 Tax=Paenibacillus agaridevorans TaxID=171404 RepID=A0A2R5EU22_9BACL|nr:hypothetical protein PAT3040_04900 [Paenibacillus agaridevorans]
MLGNVIVGCESDNTNDKAGASSTTAADNWIQDIGFDNGAMVFNPIQGAMRVNGKIDFGKNIEGEVTDWIVTQWNSRSDLAKMEGKREGDRYIYANEYKTIAVADDGTVTLGVDATKEYDGPRVRPTDPWLHLYLEQRYKEPRRLEGDKLQVRFDVRVTENVNLMTNAEYNPDLHASIAVFYLILSDMNGSGQFINFCVPIVDNRSDIPHGEWHIDSGGAAAGNTNQLIYTLDGNKIYDGPTANGEWHEVDIDIKPYAEEALAIAKQNGFLKDETYEDLGLSAIYIGWETPGIFRSSMDIKNMIISN